MFSILSLGDVCVVLCCLPLASCLLGASPKVFVHWMSLFGRLDAAVECVDERGGAKRFPKPLPRLA